MQSNSARQGPNPNGTPNFVIGLPSADVQVNGGIDGGNPKVSFYLDGGINMSGIRNYGNQLPNPDALEEFRVETSNFSAQYGRMSAAVVTAITKSGTNLPWLTVRIQPQYRFQRNALELQASTPPTIATSSAGSIGGPVLHDKAFFFFSYAGLRQVVGQFLSGGVVPTAAERHGDFTADSFDVYVPGTTTPKPRPEPR